MKRKYVFFVKKEATLGVMLWIWLVLCGLAGLILWDLKTDLNFALVVYALIWLPFVAYCFSGKRVAIFPYKKTLIRSFCLMGYSFSKKSLKMDMEEVFIVPQLIVSHDDEYLQDFHTLHYPLYIGKFKTRTLKNLEEIDLQAAESLREEALSFRHTEAFLRKLARKVFLPARIYWDHLILKHPDQFKPRLGNFTPPGKVEKLSHQLNTPFTYPPYLKEYMKQKNSFLENMIDRITSSN